MDRITAALKGQSTVEIFCAYPQDVINRAVREEIELRCVSMVSQNKLSAIIIQADVPRLRQICDTMGAEFSECGSQGGKHLKDMFRRRYSFSVMLLICAALLSLSSLFIWDVDVQGNSDISEGEIIRALEDCGLYCGASRMTISCESIKNELMTRLPDIAWMSININGSRAVAVIREREKIPVIFDRYPPSDMIAVKDGVIRRVSVLQGRSMVKPGDAAVKGQLIVSSAMRRSFTMDGGVYARATVLADTWHEINAVTPSKEERKIVGREKISGLALISGKNRINLLGNSGKAIDGCDKIIKEYKLGIEGLFASPLGLVVEIKRPYRLVEWECDDLQGMQLRLHNLLVSRTQGQIISESYTSAGTGELTVLTLRAQCMENIAQNVPASAQS